MKKFELRELLPLALRIRNAAPVATIFMRPAVRRGGEFIMISRTSFTYMRDPDCHICRKKIDQFCNEIAELVDLDSVDWSIDEQQLRVINKAFDEVAELREIMSGENDD